MADVSARCVQLKKLPKDVSEEIVRECLGQKGYDKNYLELHRHQESEDDVRWLVLFKTTEDAHRCIRQESWESDTTYGKLIVQADYCSECVIPNQWTENEDWVMMDPDDVLSQSPPSITHRNRLESINSKLFASGGKDLDDLENEPKPNELQEKNQDSSEQHRSEKGYMNVKGEMSQFGEQFSSLELFASGSQHSSGSLSVTSSQLFGDGEEDSATHSNNITKLKHTSLGEGRKVQSAYAMHRHLEPSSTHYPGYDYPPNRNEEEKNHGRVTSEEDLAKQNKELEINDAPEPETLGTSGDEQILEANKITLSAKQGDEDRDIGEAYDNVTDASVKSPENNTKPENATSNTDSSPLQTPSTQENGMMQQGLTNPNYYGLNPFLYGLPQQDMNYQNSPHQAMNYAIYMQQMHAAIMMQQQANAAGTSTPPVFFAPMTLDSKGNPVPLLPIGNQLPLATGYQMPMGNQQSRASGIQMPGGNQNFIPFENQPEIQKEFPEYDYATAVPMRKTTVKEDGVDGKDGGTINEESYVYMSRFLRQEDLEMTKTEKNDGYDKIGNIQRLAEECPCPPLPERNYRKHSNKPKEKKQDSQGEDGPDDLDIPDSYRSSLDKEVPASSNKNNLKLIIDEENGNEQDEPTRDSAEVTEYEGNLHSSKIKVTGISRSISKDTLELFFENKRSGGGDVQSVHIKEGKGEAVIEFKDPQVVRRILEKQKAERFVISDTTLLVTEHNPNVDKCKVFVSGLNKETTRQSLENYFEAKCGSTPTDVKYGETPGTAIVMFPTIQDIRVLRKACKQPLEKHYLEVSEVEVSRSVKVTGCRERESKDGLLYYFENQRKSQGGDVEDVSFQERTGAYIVTFVNVEDAERVSQNEVHTLNQTEIFVSLYYPELELDSSLIFTIPEPIELTETDTYLQRFLTKNELYHQTVDHKMASCYGQVQWPESNNQNIIISCTVQERDIQGKEKVKNWGAKCLAEMKTICDKIKVEDSLQIAKEAWSDFKEQLSEMTVQEPDKDKITLFLQAESTSLVIVGEERAIRDIVFHVRNLITRLEQELEKQQQTITKVHRVKRYQIILLVAVRFQDKFQRSSKGSVNMEMSHENAVVTFVGLKKDVDIAIDKMMQTLKGFPKRTVKGFRKESHNLLYSPQARGYIKGQLSHKKVIGIWDVNKAGELELYSKSESDLDKAVEVLKKCVQERTISISSNSGPIIDSKEWGNCTEMLETKHSGLFKVDVKQSAVLIVGTDNVVDEVDMEIQKLFDLHTIVEEFLSVDPGKFRFVQRYKAQDLQTIQTQYARLKVDIKQVDKYDKKGFQIKGEQSGCKMTIQKIKKLLEDVELKDHSMNHPHIKEFLRSNDGIKALKEIEDSTQCVMEMAIANVSRKATLTKPNVKASCPVGPCLIAVTQNDMTCTEVDSVVISRDNRLSKDTGLSAAVIEKGGVEIQTYCDKHRTTYGRPSPGKAFETKAGKLPYKILIHAVLPQYTNGTSDESLLKNSISSCLEIADKNKLKSLMFPLLGFGKHQYPLQKSAKWMFEALSEAVKVAGKLRYLEKIFVCDLRPDIVKSILRDMRTVLGGRVVLTGDSFQRNSTSVLEEDNSDDEDYSNDDDEGGSAEGAVGGAMGGTMPPKSAITVRVVVGDLDKMKVDVIVNSTNPQLNLGMGNVSKALLAAGGADLQKECIQRYPNGIKLGELAVTTGGQIKCKYIFHGLLVNWDYGGGQSEKVLKNFVTICLEEADKRRVNSVAFPALGTGNLGYPLDFVAQLMFDTVNKYQAANPDTSINHVYFVVWSGDAPAIKAFQLVESREKSWKMFASLPDKPTENTLAENRLRTNDKFKKVYDGMKVEIDQGDITQEKSDVIVNSIVGGLDLNTGQVSRAILKAAGPTIQRESIAPGNYSTLMTMGFIETSGGLLHYCKKIYHVESKTTETEWTKIVLKCLQRADSCGFSSISFPAMGTGGKGLSPESMSHAMFEAFSQFTQSPSYTHTLKHVRIVIYQQDMVKKFIAGASGGRKRIKSMNFLPGVKKKCSTADIVTIYIYGSSHSTVKMAGQKLDGLFTEETITVSKRLLQKWQTEKKTDLQEICKKYHMEIKIDGSKSCFILRGYNLYVKTFRRSLEKENWELPSESQQPRSTSGRSSENLLLPSSWRHMSPQCRFDIIQLRSDDPVYATVYARFMFDSQHAYTIKKIYCIQNKDLYRVYSYTKQTMNRGATQLGNEKQLWFPTSDLNVGNICRYGFDRSCMIDLGLGYGWNFHVAAPERFIKARCTPDFRRHYHLILANVLIGDFCIGTPRLGSAPLKPSGKETFDSVADSTLYPVQFAVFNNSQCYPAYYIVFE